jgi:AcrR family transcriptional regulator
MAGLRERKKWETRRRISDVATGLFFARGFDNVTIAEVAEAAGVSRMTVFNYFPRKEDLFLDRSAETVVDYRRAISERGQGEPVAEALRRLHRGWLAERHPMSGVVEQGEAFWKVVDETPALRARTLEQQDELRAELVDMLRAAGFDETGAMLGAGFVVAAYGTVYDTARLRIMAGDKVAKVHEDQKAVVEKVFDALADALRRLEPH